MPHKHTYARDETNSVRDRQERVSGSILYRFLGSGEFELKVKNIFIHNFFKENKNLLFE